MNIYRVKLKNWRIIKEADIDLSSGLTIIEGKNGSGKTSLIYSIIYGLYGRVEGLKKDELIHKGESYARVELFLLKNAVDYRIVREIGEKNSLAIYRDGELISSGSLKESESILDSLRIPEKIFYRFYYINSSMFSKNIFSLTKEEKRNMIELLLQIDRYREIVERLKSRESIIRQKIEDSTIVIRENKKFIEDIKNEEKNSKIFLEKREELAKKLAKLTYRKVENMLVWRNELKRLDDRLKREEKAKYSEDEIKDKLKKLEEKRENRRIKEELEKIKREIEIYQRYRICSGCSRLNQIIDFERLLQLQEKFKELKSKYRRELEQEVIEDRDKLLSMLNWLKYNREREKILKEIEKSRVDLSKLDSYIEENRVYEETKKQLMYVEMKIKSREERGKLLENCRKRIKDEENRLRELKKEKSLISSILKKIEEVSREFVLQQQLPFINSSINRRLKTFDLDIKVELKSDFSVEIEREGVSFRFKELSMGEQTRLVVATYLSFLDMIRARTEQSIDIVLVDEIDSTLDRKNFYLLLNEFKRIEDRTVLFVTHREPDFVCNRLKINFHE